MNATYEPPVDLAAVAADDARLNLLGSNERVWSESDAELAQILVAWRRDVDAEPIPVLIADGYRLPFLARMRAAVRGFLRPGGNR